MAMTARVRRVLGSMKRMGLEGLLVTDLADVRYLCGFTGSNAAVLLRPAKVTLFTDGRYTEQAAQEVEGAGVVIVEAGPAVSAAVGMALEAVVKRCGFDAATTTVAGVGAREMEVAMALEYMARLNGAEGMSFETIVAGGARSALPHGRATNAKLPRRGFVVLDFGVVLDGYCSDMTRTVHMGRGSAEEHRVYEAVLEAQEAGVAAVKAGVPASDVDEAARAVLRRHGLEEWFTHSTGHGVGVEIHEGPRLGKKRPGVEEERLRAGMVVTIEPGVYLPGKFGVRIEDTVLVTRDGCEVLTPSTKAWVEL